MRKSSKNFMLATALTLGMMSDYSSNPYMPRIPNGPSERTYNNKNSNVEYYYDEKGNIRRRKIKR